MAVGVSDGEGFQRKGRRDLQQKQKWTQREIGTNFQRDQRGLKMKSVCICRVKTIDGVVMFRNVHLLQGP